MSYIFTIALGLLLGFALVGWLADNRARLQGTQKPPMTFLPGDIKYESPSGNVKVYFPITTSIVLSIVLSLILRFFG
jgi:Protein of unknown function (DUF2905)